MIYNIFDWIMISSIKASLMIPVILLVKRLFSNRLSTAWHYYIWFLLLIKLLVPFSFESPFSISSVINPYIENFYERASESTIDASEELSSELSIELINEEDKIKFQELSELQNNSERTTVRHPVVDNSNRNMNIKNKLIILWLSGVIIFAFYIAATNLKLYLKIRNHNEHINEIDQVLSKCKSIINVNKDIPVVYSANISAPSLYGFIRPKLLLPNEILGKVSNNDLKYIFLHELSHLKRMDIAVNWLLILLKVLYWFNPVIWYGFYRMHQDCEISCDAMVLSYMKPEEHYEYGQTIIRLLEILSNKNLIPGLKGIITGKSHIKMRITMIALFKNNTFKWSVIGITLLMILGITFLTDTEYITPKVLSLNQSTEKSEKNSDNGDDVKKESQNVYLQDIKGKTSCQFYGAATYYEWKANYNKR